VKLSRRPEQSSRSGLRCDPRLLLPVARSSLSKQYSGSVGSGSSTSLCLGSSSVLWRYYSVSSYACKVVYVLRSDIHAGVCTYYSMRMMITQRNRDTLTVLEAAERIGTTVNTIRRWLRDGRLKGVKPGGDKIGYRIPTTEVDRLLGLPVIEGGTRG
jgi:excisionase family DNA binding protein